MADSDKIPQIDPTEIEILIEKLEQNKLEERERQIVRNAIHRMPPKVRLGIDGNDKRNGDHKSGAIAESEGLRAMSH